MTARVINDPSALGWNYDAETGRWTWGGSDSSGGGDGTFPEAPVDGLQYARQDAGWSEIVHPEGAGGDIITTSDVKLTNPTLRSPVGLDTQEDANQYFVGELAKLIDEDGNVIGGDGGGGIPEAPIDNAIYGRKNADWVVVPTSGGGDGPDMSLYYTASQCDAKYQPKGSYDNYGGWQVKVNNGTALAVTKNATLDFVGSGNTTISRANGVITISSTGLTSYTETDPTVPTWVKSITQADINKWNNPPSGGNYTGSNGVSVANNVISLNGGYTGVGGWTVNATGGSGSSLILENVGGSQGCQIGLMNGGGANNKFIRAIAGNLEVVNSNYSATIFYINNAGSVYANGSVNAQEVTASSDARLKENLTPVRAGVITQLEGFDYNWKEDGKKGSGFIAQEVQEIPELCHLVTVADEKTGTLGISYNGMIPYLLAEIKALKAEIEALKS